MDSKTDNKNLHNALDPTIGLTTRIKSSRLFLNSYYFCALYPIPFCWRYKILWDNR